MQTTETQNNIAPAKRPQGFQKGQIANPTGKTGPLMKGYQPYGKRLLYWIENYDTYQLIALKEDKLRFGKLNPLDSACVLHLVDCVQGKARGEALERALNRMEGAPKGNAVDVNVNINGEVNHTHELGKQARELIASRITGIASRVGTESGFGRTEPGTIDITPMGLEVLGETKATDSER